MWKLMMDARAYFTPVRSSDGRTLELLGTPACLRISSIPALPEGLISYVSSTVIGFITLITSGGVWHGKP